MARHGVVERRCSLKKRLLKETASTDIYGYDVAESISDVDATSTQLIS